MFKENGIHIEENFLSIDLIELLQRYCQYRVTSNEWEKEEFSNTSSFKKYADPLIESLLAYNLPKAEEIVGRKLYPTYSYIRLYTAGDKMLIHSDRPSCEISVSINIAHFGKSKNPLCYENVDGEMVEVYQKPGDAFFYLGREIPHGRYPHSEDQVTLQCMLHYVYQDGEFKACKFDNRPDLGQTLSTRTKSEAWMLKGKD
tara:strand:- start:1340 stop:1942 length:603 start_codon:yes stop_codon:yes gene_type:complete